MRKVRERGIIMKKKKVLSLLLALSLCAGMTACGGNSGDDSQETDAAAESGEDTEVAEDDAEDTEEADADAESDASGSGEENPMPEGYEEESAAVYEAALGEFKAAYDVALATDNTVAERYALMAVAEAKLMESGVMVPTTTAEGRYAISRVAPYSVDYTLWGTDYERYHQALVATDFIKNEDRSEMKAKWAELRGTGTYEQWAKDYLEEKGYTLKDEYIIAYGADPVTWDQMSTSLASDSSAIVNVYDGLLEYDVEGYLQPALAETYEVSDDGLTYTFHLREGVEWVDSQGRKVADVVADDFVAGFQHMLDAQGGLEYLVQGVIVNADEYINGEVTDMAEVGVKALDDYTVEYTLCEPIPYFDTMLGYSIFAPMSRTYYESQGGKFGAEFDSSAPDYTYGKDSNSIAYCGPYLVTNATEKNTIVFKANESYWNKDNINVKTITWLYNDNSDVTKRYNDTVAGTVDWTPLNTSTIPTAKEDGLFDDYAYVTDTDATSYTVFHNLNRHAFANFNDDTVGVSPQSEEETERTNAAMQNVHFRRALCFGLDRAAYNAQSVGEELKELSLRNTYTQGNFVSLPEEATIDINGTPTTFAEGTYYAEIVQAQMDADGFPVKVWDPEANDGIGSGDGFDGWYSPENAMAELTTAIEELEAEGVTVDEENPIQIDIPYPSVSELYSNKANAYKKSIEASLEGKVIVNLVDCVDLNGWYYAGYYTSYGYESNYDVYDLTGWIPDFGDPCSYLDTCLPDYAGYQTKCYGIY